MAAQFKTLTRAAGRRSATVFSLQHRCNSHDVHWPRLASGIVRRLVL